MSAGNMNPEEGAWTGAIPVRAEGTEADQIATARPYMELAAAKAGVTITGWRVSDEPLPFGSRHLDPKTHGLVIVYADGTT